MVFVPGGGVGKLTTVGDGCCGVGVSPMVGPVSFLNKDNNTIITKTITKARIIIR